MTGLKGGLGGRAGRDELAWLVGCDDDEALRIWRRWADAKAGLARLPKSNDQIIMRRCIN